MTDMGAEPPGHPADIVVLSHLRWGFVYQRPQHLMSRAARDRRVFFVEEPVRDALTPELEEQVTAEGVTVCVPRMPPDISATAEDAILSAMMSSLVHRHALDRYVLWYETPRSSRHTRHLTPAMSVYDCMDELSAFAGAPPDTVDAELELLGRVDLVFTGGRSLYERKRDLHPSVHAFPSSVDVGHFAAARGSLGEPDDQAPLPRPRIGFFGVIDERADLALLAAVADARPEWQIVMVGPVVKIDPTSLPARDNIHYLGPRAYDDLPAYLAGWDVAIMPFARNAATRFISPTKTLEYLAAGRPVVSTSIPDVVEPYGARGLVRIADAPAGFVAAIEASMSQDREAWLRSVDAHLRTVSWDRTWHGMDALLRQVDAAAARSAVVA
jgi:glycosyltransferase involved in cell wall biosynthesis